MSFGIIPTGLSDHRRVYAVLKAIKPHLPPRTITARCYRSFDDEAYDADVSTMPWSSVEACESADDAWGHFKSLLTELEDRHAPEKTRTIRGRPSPGLPSTSSP